MSITLPLNKMSAEEKNAAGSRLSPDWHGTVLADRKAAVLAGEDKIIDWETAKQKISEELQ